MCHLAVACVITLSCVALQQCFGGYISGKLLMGVLGGRVQLLFLSPGVAGERYGVMQLCEKEKSLTNTSVYCIWGIYLDKKCKLMKAICGLPKKV